MGYPYCGSIFNFSLYKVIDKFLILDLDNTLICVSEEPDYKIEITDPFTKKLSFIGIKKRPYLDFFLDFVSKKYKLILWSNGSAEYIHKVLDCITNVHFTNVITRETFGTLPIKDLNDLKTLININLNNIIFIDDSPEHIQGLKSNQIIVAPKYVGHYDTFLIDIIYNLS
jgi:RNA polymerase II subunit A small phosphatase-like protein